MTNRTAEKTEACAAALRRHRFEAEVVKDAEAAFALMKAVVEAENPQLVSFGDSMTMRGTGIVEWLRSNGRLTLLDGFDASKPSFACGEFSPSHFLIGCRITVFRFSGATFCGSERYISWWSLVSLKLLT